MKNHTPQTLISIDTGGTFTDFVVLSPTGLTTHKVLSTPHDPSLAISQGLKELGLKQNFSIVHGTTVATNALLEAKGARVVLITTEGFEDVLEIGRQNRSKLYDLEIDAPPLLVESHRRLGIKERIDAKGKRLLVLSENEIRTLLKKLKKLSFDSIAICLLSSYKNPIHEILLANKLKTFKKPLSLSSKISPEFREYERCSTTCVNAYVAPIMSQYLNRLEKKIRQPIRVMQSNGGSLSIREATEEAVRTLLSGPAGGALGALAAAKESGIDKILSFDMGGTSTDMSLMNGTLEMTSESEVGGHPVKTPMIRIDTIGAGGGSLAWVDAGGALRVGPQSAGADPGPICYGRGGSQMTITDAHVWLGRIPPQHFLGGTMSLHPKKIKKPLQALAKKLRLSELATAEGIIAVANANMAKALRVLSLERGYDPRLFTLVPFGGAGGLHACELADALGMNRVLIPHHPGLLSAIGMAHADWVKDYVKTVLLKENQMSTSKLKIHFKELEKRTIQDAARERFLKRQIRFKKQLDVRYVGQGYELTIEETPHIRGAFETSHQKNFGYLHKDRPIEIVNIRLQARVSILSPSVFSSALERKGKGEKELIKTQYKNKIWNASLYQRDNLKIGNSISGPAIIAEYSATTLVPPGWSGMKQNNQNLILERK